MSIRSIWVDDYSSSDPHLNENIQQSLYAFHEQIMEMSGIKLLYDTETNLWGWEGICMILKGYKSDIIYPSRTVAILDAATKLLMAYQYNKQITQIA